MLQFTDPERLGNKEGLNGDTWISFGMGNRRDLLGGLRESGDGNLRDSIGQGVWRRRVLKKMTGN